MLGVASMLVVAGCIEGFFSPMNIAEEIKLTAASGIAVLMVSYFVLGGRKKTASDSAGRPFGELMTPLPPV
jgi:hypothetical protein